MAEGSGFLQWLSVYALALSRSVNTLLLDEPDAHLHPSLQVKLVDILDSIARDYSKQIFMATHSTEILRNADHTTILQFSGNSADYLRKDEQKIALFIGLGSHYAPKIDPLRHRKRLLLVENLSDYRLLKAFSNVLGIEWPEQWVAWAWTGGSKERKMLFNQLKSEIPGLKAISIRDRDDLELNQVDPITLRDKSIASAEAEGLFLKVWRRRHIENYTLCPEAIALATSKTSAEINDLFADHSLIIGSSFPSRDAPSAI